MEPSVYSYEITSICHNIHKQFFAACLITVIFTEFVLSGLYAYIAPAIHNFIISTGALDSVMPGM